MRTGKLSEAALRRSVLKPLHTKKSPGGIATYPAVGADYAAIAASGEEIVLGVGLALPQQGAAGRSGVLRALGNVACAGAKPVGVLTSVLAPIGMSEQELRALMEEIADACEEAGVAALGGHTEVTPAVNGPIVTVTGVGTVPAGERILSGAIEPGMDILATKWIGLEGTAILARERGVELSGRFSEAFLDGAKRFSEELSVLREASVAAKSGAASMHDASSGGIFGALWEFAQGSGVGLEIDLRRLPIRQETVEICEFFDVNPYRLSSGGCLLIAARDGDAVLDALLREGCKAVRIGRATDGSDRVVRNGEERRFLEKAQTDELYRILN